MEIQKPESTQSQRLKALYQLSLHPGFEVLIEEIQQPGIKYCGDTDGNPIGLPMKDADKTAFQTASYVGIYTREILTHLKFMVGQGERLTQLDAKGETAHAENESGGDTRRRA